MINIERARRFLINGIQRRYYLAYTGNNFYELNSSGDIRDGMRKYSAKLLLKLIKLNYAITDTGIG